jgi:hypothetical protein
MEDFVHFIEAAFSGILIGLSVYGLLWIGQALGALYMRYA